MQKWIALYIKLRFEFKVAFLKRLSIYKIYNNIKYKKETHFGKDGTTLASNNMPMNIHYVTYITQLPENITQENISPDVNLLQFQNETHLMV